MRVTKSPPLKDTGPKNARTKEFEQEACMHPSFPNEKPMDVNFTKLLPAFRFLGGAAGVTVPNFPEASRQRRTSRRQERLQLGDFGVKSIA